MVIEKATNIKPWSIQQMESSFDVGHTCLVIEDTNIKGFLIYGLAFPEAHLLNIAIHPHYQDIGIGSQLMDHFINQLKVIGSNLITLEVRVSNTNAIKFYKKYGFHEDAIRQDYYSDPFKEDALLMSLRI
tara:strand:+ start:29644 stop:30033 length:390 start_codon:yes stop_codon:yes gene_type:complete